MTPEEDRKQAEEQKQMASLAIDVGLAESMEFDFATKRGRLHWKKDGEIFADQLVMAHDKIAKGKGEKGMREFLNLLTFIIVYKRQQPPT